MSKLDILWAAIGAHIDEIKALPDDIIIGLIDNHTNYGKIDPSSIEKDDKHVWVQLNRNHKVTLLEKSDYQAIDYKSETEIPLIAQAKITEVFSFSQSISPKLLFKDWI